MVPVVPLFSKFLAKGKRKCTIFEGLMEDSLYQIRYLVNYRRNKTNEQIHVWNIMFNRRKTTLYINCNRVRPHYTNTFSKIHLHPLITCFINWYSCVGCICSEQLISGLQYTWCRYCTCILNTPLLRLR